MEIKLFDSVVTTVDKGSVKKGTQGAVVEIWRPGELYEIELFDSNGKTIDVFTPPVFGRLTIDAYSLWRFKSRVMVEDTPQSA